MLFRSPSTINAIETGNKQAPDYVIANTVNDKYQMCIRDRVITIDSL